ncbi:MAG: hypothetical protein SFH39_06965 [Candidatus Magnetobacterium sp. LHC-1]|nr:hypothetical protein [Candidatus Magnetobacterium casensis]
MSNKSEDECLLETLCGHAAVALDMTRMLPSKCLVTAIPDTT